MGRTGSQRFSHFSYGLLRQMQWLDRVCLTEKDFWRLQYLKEIFIFLFLLYNFILGLIYIIKNIKNKASEMYGIQCFLYEINPRQVANSLGNPALSNQFHICYNQQ